MQLTSYSLAKALEDLIAASGVFDAAEVYVGLYQTWTNQGLNTTMADIVPATGSVSNLVQVTDWSPVYLAKSGLEVVDAQTMVWSPTTPADAQTVQGVYLTDASPAGNLLGVIPFAANVSLAGPTSRLSVVVRLTLDPTGTWDATVTWDD